MDKEQAIYSFWSSFGVPAYNENSTPPNAEFPRITYDVVTGFFGTEAAMSAKLSYRSSSWAGISEKLHEIERALRNGGIQIPCDGGTVWIKPAQPFAQSVGDSNDDAVRQYLINISAQYNITA